MTKPTAEDDDDEGLEQLTRPERGTEGEERAAEEAGEPREPRTDAEGQRVDLLDVDPHHRAAVRILRHRADRLSHVRPGEEEMKHDERHDGDPEHRQAIHWKRNAEQPYRIGRVARPDGLVVAGEEEISGVAQDEPHTEEEEQGLHRAGGAARKVADEESINHYPEEERNDDDDGDGGGRIDPELLVHHPAEVG